MPYKSFLEYCINEKPSLLEEWDTSCNGELTANIAFATHKKFWFTCSNCGTHFQTSPHSLTRAKHNCCPACWISNRAHEIHKTACNKNNLEKQGGLLLQEFDKDKNTIKPSEVTLGSNKQYWWKCSNCGNEWKASVSNRSKGSGCPHCRRASHTSFPEQAVFFYVKKAFPDAISGDKHLGMEFDFFIPSINVAIEYDGEAWHQDIKKDEKKNRICEKNRICLIRIREQNCWFWPLSPYLQCFSSVSGDNRELSETIKRVLFAISHDYFPADVDVDRDEKEIKATYLYAKKDNSLAKKYPNISREWDFKKNAPITPDRIDYGSGTEYWWKCPQCGFSYKATPNSRTCKGSGCPSCAHIVPVPGITDFQTIRPDLMKEWDFEKNNSIGLFPNEILANSEKKAWWHCSTCGHEWFAMVGSRNRGRGCPKCAKNKHKRQVKNLDTGQVFDSVEAAGIFYGKKKNNHISECCRGIRKTALGYKWAFVK